MSVQTSSSNFINSLESKIVINLCTGKFNIDIADTVYKVGGEAAILGAKVKVENPYGVIIKDFTSEYDIPSVSGSVSGQYDLDIPSQSGHFQFGHYIITVSVVDAEAKSFIISKDVVLSEPDKSCKDKNYGIIKADIKGDCVNGKVYIDVWQPPTYNGVDYESLTQSYDLEYPTSSEDAITVSVSNFSVKLYEGIYKISGEACVTYNLTNNVFANVKYNVSAKKEIFCSIDYSCVFHNLLQLHELIKSECSPAKKEEYASISLEALLLLKTATLAAQVGEDPSEFIEGLQELLACKCGGCDCANPTNILDKTPTTDFSIEGCNVGTSHNGQTTTFTIDNFEYEVAFSPNDGSITASTTTIKNVCTKVLNFIVDKGKIGAYGFANDYFDDAVTDADNALIIKTGIASRTGNVVHRLLDNFTGEEVSFTKVIAYPNGVPYNNSDIDGVIVRKKGSEFFKRNYTSFINAKWFGAKGDGLSDDTVAVRKAILSSSRYICIVFLPKGVYLLSSTIATGDIRGFCGESKTSTIFKAISNMSIMFDCRTMASGLLHDFKIDCDNKANIGILTDYGHYSGPTWIPEGGGSLNNSYYDIFIEHHLDCAWQANDNNDCYFDRILIAGGNTSIRSVAAGGPLQFHNCNFLGHVEVAGQYISFINCVTGGVKLKGSGFDVFKYEGGYAFPSPVTGITFEVLGDTSNNGNHPLIGPATFSGSHLQVAAGGYLIGGGGTFHYGANATGCHIFVEPYSGTKGSLLQSSLTSILAPACTSKFVNCNIEHINLDFVSGIFPIEYEKCYVDNVLINHAEYFETEKKLSVRNGGATHIEMFNNGVDDFGIRMVRDGWMNFEIRRMAGGSTGGIKFMDGDSLVEFMCLNIGGQLGLGTSSPHSSALFNMESTTKGLLIPRMTKTQRNLIPPVKGLLVYVTDGNGYLSEYKATGWEKFSTVAD